VGPECKGFLETLSVEDVHTIKSKCLDFYITAVQDMLKRLPCRDIFFEHLAFLDPQIALYNEGRIKIRDLTYIATRVKHINVTQLAYEWRLYHQSLMNKRKKLAFLEIDEMWKNILEAKNFDGTKIFSNFRTFG